MLRLPGSGLSRIAAFLAGDGRDGAGRTVSEVLAFDDDQLEGRHDFIQWLFPLPEPSRAVPGSPVLTGEDIAVVRLSPAAQASLRAAAERMLRFYSATRTWRASSDHNHLRITRIIRSLRLLTSDAEADAFRSAVLKVLGPDRSRINPTTLQFWSAA